MWRYRELKFGERQAVYQAMFQVKGKSLSKMLEHSQKIGVGNIQATPSLLTDKRLVL